METFELHASFGRCISSLQQTHTQTMPLQRPTANKGMTRSRTTEQVYKETHILRQGALYAICMQEYKQTCITLRQKALYAICMQEYIHTYIHHTETGGTVRNMYKMYARIHTYIYTQAGGIIRNMDASIHTQHKCTYTYLTNHLYL